MGVKTPSRTHPRLIKKNVALKKNPGEFPEFLSENMSSW
jgi:hypothetical protein